MSFPVVRFVYRGTEADAETSRSPRPYTVVWDGSCRTCAHLVRLLEAWDREQRIETVPSQDTRVLERFPWIPPEAYAQAVQLVGPGGETWAGAAAIEKLLEILPRGRWPARLFRIPGIGRLADRFYRWFARNRYRFGCGEHCQSRPSAGT